VSMLLAGCGAGPGDSDLPSPTATATSSATATGFCSSGDLSVDRGPYAIAGMQVPGYGFPDMGANKVDVALRTVVVSGTATARGPGFFAEPARVYTPFTVDVDRVIRGDARVDAMRVAVEGGAVGCYTLRVDVAPAIDLGRRYVFFLTDFVGAEPAPRAVWDAWLVDANGLVSTPQGPMPLAELVARIDRLSAGQSSSTP